MTKDTKKVVKALSNGWIDDRLPKTEGSYKVIGQLENGEIVVVVACWNGELFVTDFLPNNSPIFAWKELETSKE